MLQNTEGLGRKRRPATSLYKLKQNKRKTQTNIDYIIFVEWKWERAGLDPYAFSLNVCILYVSIPVLSKHQIHTWDYLIARHFLFLSPLYHIPGYIPRTQRLPVAVPHFTLFLLFHDDQSLESSHPLPKLININFILDSFTAALTLGLRTYLLSSMVNIFIFTHYPSTMRALFPRGTQWRLRETKHDTTGNHWHLQPRYLYHFHFT